MRWGNCEIRVMKHRTAWRHCILKACGCASGPSSTGVSSAPASARADALGARPARAALPVRGAARPVARRDQPARDGPGVHHAAVARPAARLRLRGAQGLRRAPRSRTDRVRVLPPAGSRAPPRSSPRASCSSPTASAAAWSARWAWRCCSGRWSAPSRRSRTASTSSGTSSSRAASRAASPSTSALLIAAPVMLVGFVGLLHSAFASCAGAGGRAPAVPASAARRRPGARALRHGDGVLHRALHA